MLSGIRAVCAVCAYGLCHQSSPAQHNRRRSSYASAMGAIEPPIEHTPQREEVRRIDFPFSGPIRIQQQPFALNNTARGYDGTTGLALWSGSYVLAHYIDNMFRSEEYWKIDNDNYSDVEGKLSRQWVFLELGAGLGLPSAMAAKCGMDVIATDYDDAVLPLLEDNMMRNLDDEGSTSCPRPRVYKLDWIEATSADPVFCDLQENGRKGADVILLSDVIYGATRPLWESLLVLLNKLRKQHLRLLVKEDAMNDYKEVVRCDGTVSPRGDPLVLMSYTQRRRDMSAEEEGRFFAMLKAVGMEPHLVPFQLIPHGEEFLLTSLYELRWA